MRILKIKGHGKNWCHGECLSTEELCVKESSVEVNKSLPVSKREEGPSGVAESSTGVAERSGGVAESSTGVAESSAGVAKRSAGVAERSGGVAESPPATSVNCGAHLASSCEECPQVMLIDGESKMMSVAGQEHDLSGILIQD